MKSYFFITTLLLLMACQSGKHDSAMVTSIEIRDALAIETPISIKEDIDSIEYVTLETNDSCLMRKVKCVQITKDYIFAVQCASGNSICQFDRKGRFIRNISTAGHGWGDVKWVLSLAANEQDKELYVIYPHADTQCYSFDGEFLRTDKKLTQFSDMSFFADSLCALKGRSMLSGDVAPWAGAIKKIKNERILSAKSMYTGKVDLKYCFMSNIEFMPSEKGVLLFEESNDTLFRITPSGILPVYRLNRKNNPTYYKNVSDIRLFMKPETFEPSTIRILDFFETKNNLYIRFFDEKNTYVAQFDCQTGEIKVQAVPEDFLKSSICILSEECAGIENDIDGGVPIWPVYASPSQGVYAQVATFRTIERLKNRGYLVNAHSALNIGRDDNPVIIMYWFK